MIIKEDIDMRRTPFAQYPTSISITKYKNLVIDMLKYNFPLLTETELAAAVDYSISKHFSDRNVKIDNNYKKRLEDYKNSQSSKDSAPKISVKGSANGGNSPFGGGKPANNPFGGAKKSPFN